MNFDTAHRHAQALDSSALTTIRTTLHAIEQGIVDCRNADVDPDTDPAVVLLARHLASVSSNHADCSVLQAACWRRLDDIARFPALLTFAISGVAFDAAAKDRFHRDSCRALRLLAQALALVPGSHAVSSWMGDASQSGAVTLVDDRLSVTLRVGGLSEGREVTYRAIKDSMEQPPCFAPMRALLDAPRFADRLRRELALDVIENSAAQKLLMA